MKQVELTSENSALVLRALTEMQARSGYLGVRTHVDDITPAENAQVARLVDHIEANLTATPKSCLNGR